MTPVALAEAMVLTKNLFNGQSLTMDYENIPSAVFSHPNVGTVGLSESDARVKYGDVDVYESSFRALKQTITLGAERTYMKLLVEPKSQKVVGVHMVGPEAGEIIQGMAVAMKCGATKADFDTTIGIHPTSAEEFVTMRTKRQ